MLKKSLDSLQKLANGIAIAACAFTGAVIVIQVLSRLIIGQSFRWTEEMAQLAVIMCVFLMTSEAEKINQHLRMEAFVDTLPENPKFIITFAGKILMAVYAGIVLYSSVLMLPTAAHIKAPASGLPLSVIYGLMVFGSALWVIQTVINLCIMLRERGSKV